MIDTQVQELEILVAVVQQGNFARAAEALSIAPSAVSRGIGKLEAKLRVSLFHRTTRQIRLTRDGEWLYEQALGITAQLAVVESRLRQAGERPEGELRCDAASPFTLHAIAPLVAGFHRQYPGITLTLTSTESLVDLVERQVDVAIRIGPLADSGLKARKLGDCYRRIYASPDYLARHGRPRQVADLANHSCLGFSRAGRLNRWPLNSDEGVEVTPAIYADNGETLKQLAIQGAGLCCLSSFTAAQAVRDGALVTVLADQTQTIAIPVHAVFYAEQAMQAKLRCFLDYLAAHICLGD